MDLDSVVWKIYILYCGEQTTKVKTRSQRLFLVSVVDAVGEQSAEETGSDGGWFVLSLALLPQHVTDGVCVCVCVSV